MAIVTTTAILDDVCDLIVDCEHKTAPTQSEGYPSIRTPNIGRGRLLLDGVNRVSEETYRLWTQRAVPRAGDLILAREAPIGNVAIVPENLKVCLGQRTVLIRPNKQLVDPMYMVYLLLGDEIQGRIQSLSNGATVHHLNMADIHGLTLPPLPPLPTQRKIAAILSAYDDLIENNMRRIALLEEMARALYREWFVEFRYPGHEGVPLVESSLGPIPQRWEVVQVGSVYSALYDGPHATPPPSDEGPVFLGIKNMTEDGHLNLDEVRHIAESDYSAWTRRVDPQPDDIVFTYEAALHRYAMIPRGFRGCLGRRVALIRPNRNRAAPHYLFRYLLSDRWHKTVSQHVVPGATVDRIPLIELPTFEMIVPPLDIQQQAGAIFSDYGHQIENYQATRQALRRTRDLLLPKLVSGEVDVAGMEIEAGDV